MKRQKQLSLSEMGSRIGTGIMTAENLPKLSLAELGEVISAAEAEFARRKAEAINREHQQKTQSRLDRAVQRMSHYFPSWDEKQIDTIRFHSEKAQEGHDALRCSGTQNVRLPYPYQQLVLSVLPIRQDRRSGLPIADCLSTNEIVAAIQSKFGMLAKTTCIKQAISNLFCDWKIETETVNRDGRMRPVYCR